MGYWPGTRIKGIRNPLGWRREAPKLNPRDIVPWPGNGIKGIRNPLGWWRGSKMNPLDTVSGPGHGIKGIRDLGWVTGGINIEFP